MTVTVTGLKELITACKVIDAKLPAEVRQINKDAAEIVAAAARGLAPVRSGRLQGSIRAGATQKAGTVKAGGGSIPYGPPIHWGWPRHHIRPNPFLVRALEGNVDKVVETYARNLQSFLDRNF